MVTLAKKTIKYTGMNPPKGTCPMSWPPGIYKKHWAGKGHVLIVVTELAKYVKFNTYEHHKAWFYLRKGHLEVPTIPQTKEYGLWRQIDNALVLKPTPTEATT